MLARDERRVAALLSELRKKLGTWAGVWEVEPNYRMPSRTSPAPPLELVRKHWSAVLERVEGRYNGRGQWGLPSKDSPANSAPLRTTGEPVLGLIAAVDAGVAGKEHCLARLRQGLDFLLSVQTPDGLFPFPDLRGRDNFFGPMVERALRGLPPEAVRNGWIVQDTSDGGQQFDNGVCGAAMAEGFELTKDSRYLSSARRSADWAAARPCVPNFNYNAFSVWLLALVYRHTGDQRYLDSAIEKTRIGVIPAQMEDGRWLDPHNARQTYHWIIVRGLLALYSAIPEAHPFRTVAARHLNLAVDNGAREILDHGAVSNITPIAVLADVCRQMKSKPQWLAALDLLGNSFLESAGDDPSRLDALCYSAGRYLRYCEKAAR
jgi:hypothetical protein